MRLNEVSPQEAMTFNMKNWPNVKHVYDFLSNKGYKYLGEGSYSSIWGPPNDSGKVVKVSSYGDYCWRYYVEQIKKYPNNPHLSKVQSLVSRASGPDEFYFIAIMEKLERIHEWNGLDLNKLTTEKDIQNLIIYEYFTQKGNLYAYDTADMIVKTPYYKENLTDKNLTEVAQLVKDTFNQSPHAEEAWNVILDIEAKGGCSIDMHGGNVMLRKQTNDIVLTDPVAGPRDDEFNINL